VSDPFFVTKPNLSQKKTLKMGTSLVMQQSLRVLQMPIIELCEWLDQTVTENPLLEWENDSFSRPRYAGSNEYPDIRKESSLFEHLMKQAYVAFGQGPLLNIAEWIIGNLEPTGFFTLSLSEIPFPCDENDRNLCLKEIKEFDPPGIAARDLRESLLLQLIALGKENSRVFQIVTTDLEAVIEKNFPYLKKKYNLKGEDSEKILKELSALSPFPGYAFDLTPTAPLSVDAVVLEQEDLCTIEIIEPTLPIPKTLDLTSLNREDTAFCKSYETEGRQLVEAIKKRTRTLQKICTLLVKKQKAYLSLESVSLVPLTIEMLSSELGLHESTVTRALAEKNISCLRGIIPLKSLLSKGLTEELSSDCAQKLLRKLIAEESKRSPLSDRELLEKMRDLGVPCARRTITKYRKVLKIPSKRGRKSLT